MRAHAERKGRGDQYSNYIDRSECIVSSRFITFRLHRQASIKECKALFINISDSRTGTPSRERG